VGFASPAGFAALALPLCFASAALAQDATAPAPANAAALPASPPVAQPAAAPPTAAQSLPVDLQDCLQETGDYITRGKTVFYVIGIANACKARLRCEIFADVTGARGSSSGHTVMVLGPAGSGEAARKIYNMRVRAAGGLAQVSRECKAL
jgi:hypothetical protein